MFSKNIIGALLLSLTGLFACAVQAAQPNVVSCPNCSSGASFAIKATNSYDDIQPPILQGVKTVFIVNARTLASHYYEVTRTYDAPNGDPQIGDFFTTSVRLTTPPPAEAQAVDGGLVVIQLIGTELNRAVSAQDLNLPFDSALDLVGPNTSNAGFFRLDLSTALSDRYNTRFRTILENTLDASTRIAEIILGDSGLADGQGRVIVNFPDGSSVSVRVTNIGLDFQDWTTVEISFDVDPRNVRIPGMRAVPQNGGQLNGVNGTVDAALQDSLNEFIRRLGFTVNGGNGGGRTCDFSCSVGPDPADPSTETSVCFVSCNP